MGDDPFLASLPPRKATHSSVHALDGKEHGTSLMSDARFGRQMAITSGGAEVKGQRSIADRFHGNSIDDPTVSRPEIIIKLQRSHDTQRKNTDVICRLQ